MCVLHLNTDQNGVIIQLLLWLNIQHLGVCAAVVCLFVVFVLEPTQLSAELHVALQSCLHFKEFKRASSKHSPGKVSTDEHTV